jgi:hypothetical protein
MTEIRIYPDSWPARHPKVSWTITAILSVGGLVGVSAYDGHSIQTKTPDDSTGGLVVPTRALDFGERLDGRPFSWELPVTNTADQPVEIAGIDTSCNCADVQPREFTLGPGETRALRLDINLHRPLYAGMKRISIAGSCAVCPDGCSTLRHAFSISMTNCVRGARP